MKSTLATVRKGICVSFDCLGVFLAVPLSILPIAEGDINPGGGRRFQYPKIRDAAVHRHEILPGFI